MRPKRVTGSSGAQISIITTTFIHSVISVWAIVGRGTARNLPSVGVMIRYRLVMLPLTFRLSRQITSS